MITEEFVPLSPQAVAQLLDRRSAAAGAAASHPVRHERRRHDRGGFLSMVEVWIPLAEGESEHVLATCRDLSAGGVGITCDRELPTDITVPIAIHQPEMTFHGEATIRYCMHGPGGYHVGMEFLAEPRP